MSDKKKRIVLTILFVGIVLLLLWTRTYYADAKFQLPGIVFILLIAAFAIAAAWILYRKEWPLVLGLSSKGITKKILWRAFGTGLLINLICSSVTYISYFLIFKETPSQLFGDTVNPLTLLSMALILAPLVEELLFRGFVQGMWQRLYSDKEKMPVKLIIAVTAFLFAISHFGFLFNISWKQFLLTTVGIFICALYLGWLRYKYQSIIPSIFAHLGFNALMVVAPIIGLIVMLIIPGKFNEIRRQQEIAPYINDTVPYDFNPNDTAEWRRSYEKFSKLERPRSEEIRKHLKGKATSVQVFFTIDTCGNIYNVHAGTGSDSSYLKSYGYNFAADAIKTIESMPPCKPYIIDGRKVEKKMSVIVPIYPF